MKPTRWRHTVTAPRSTRPSATSSASSCGTAPTTTSFSRPRRTRVTPTTSPCCCLDLKAPEGEPGLSGDVRQAATDEDRTIEWSLEEVTPAYFHEIAERRTKELGIKEKYVRKSLQFLISESAKKIAKYDTQLRQLRDETDPKRLSLQGN